MIVVMQPDATEADIARVKDRLVEHHLIGHISQGEERTVIGVVGSPIVSGLGSELEALSGVETTVRITKPYKLASREFHPHNTKITIRDVVLGGDEVIVMAGPCSVESEDQILRTAEAVREAGARILRGGAYKPRTSPYSFRGMGERGLELLAKAREVTGLPIITEVMTPNDLPIVSAYADILQIGARNMQNYLLLEEAGRGKLASDGQAGTGSDDRGMVAGSRICYGPGQPERHPVRTRYPHLRNRHPQHLRPERRGLCQACFTPAGRRRSEPRHG